MAQFIKIKEQVFKDRRKGSKILTTEGAIQMAGPASSLFSSMSSSSSLSSKILTTEDASQIAGPASLSSCSSSSSLSSKILTTEGASQIAGPASGEVLERPVQDQKESAETCKKYVKKFRLSKQGRICHHLINCLLLKYISIQCLCKQN